MSTRPRTPAPATPAPGKLPLPELLEMKKRHDKIVMITAYDAPAARIADEAGVELILVGDTAAMVMLGHESTLPVTLDEMIFLTRAVTRAARRPLVVGDLPFGTYEVSDEQAVASAIRMVKEGGADVVKLEGAGRMLSRVRAIADSNIGIMGHVGLTPQSATKLGGFKAQGRTGTAAKQLFDDALALQEAGAFAIVLEAVPAPVAARVSAALDVPTIGIGAGAATDGQVLVWHDMLGMYAGRTPRFVKRYADIASEIGDAVSQYADDVRDGRVPRGAAHLRHLLRRARALRGRGQNDLSARPSTIGTTTASPQAPSARCQVQPCTARTPITSSTTAQATNAYVKPAKTTPPAPESLPPLRKTSSPKTASLTGQSTSDSAIGTQANASTWRARR